METGNGVEGGRGTITTPSFRRTSSISREAKGLLIVEADGEIGHGAHVAGVRSGCRSKHSILYGGVKSILGGRHD